MNMTRHLIFALSALASMLLASCNDKTQYTIDGHAADKSLEGQTVYLVDNNNDRAYDSATVVDGKFTMQGLRTNPTLNTIYCNSTDGNRYYGLLMIEPGTIYIDIVNDSLSGTELNDKLAAFLFNAEEMQDQNALRNIVVELQSAPDPQSAAPLFAIYDSLSQEITKRTLARSEKFYNENKDNELGAYALNNIAQLKEMNYKTFDSILSASHPRISAYTPNVELLQVLRALDQTSAGHPYIDITGHLFVKNAEGNYAMGDSTNLSNLIEGKIAIVDFWASWCGPCVQEIKENLIDLSKKYANKGVVIVGVDLSDTEKGLSNIMQRLNIPYPVLVADENPAATYGFNGIPQIMLINQDGIIVQRDLRGEQIEEAIVAALAAQQ